MLDDLDWYCLITAPIDGKEREVVEDLSPVCHHPTAELYHFRT